MSTRVFIVEDHPVLREALVEYVNLSDDLELCGVAASGEEALDALEPSGASIVVLDLSLPGMSGFALLERIKERWDLPCLVVSGHGEAAHVRRALDAGADGYMLKGRLGDLARAIHTIGAGARFMSESLAPTAAPGEAAG